MNHDKKIDQANNINRRKQIDQDEQNDHLTSPEINQSHQTAHKKIVGREKHLHERHLMWTNNEEIHRNVTATCKWTRSHENPL